MTLADFLLARVAEDEERARNATVGPWWYDPSKMNAVDHEESVFAGKRGPSAVTVASTGPCDDIGSMADADHIARHDPARVLAECEAKRQIVEALVDAEQTVAGYDSDDPNNPPSYWQEWGNRHAWREAAGLLALPYADHPDYREEWRVAGE